MDISCFHLAMTAAGLVGLLVWCVVHQTSTGIQWTPQYGTARHPKIPELSPRATPGDIFLINGRHFRSLASFDLDPNGKAMQNMPNLGKENAVWSALTKGSYLLPKIFGEDTICETGDIFLDLIFGIYYEATNQGHTQVGVLHSHNVDTCKFRAVDEKANWMSLLKPIIGDRKIGDIYIPGVHDSGTAGIDENSYLVDQNYLFKVASRMSPEMRANWSKTQPDRFDAMLNSGFRNLDLRVADMNEADETFRWWHEVTGDEIDAGLASIAEFAKTHPEEFLVLDFGHFVAPRNASQPENPIPIGRKDKLSDIILKYLGSNMAPKQGLSDNPTMNELLAAGNIMAVMRDDYIRNKDDRYWPIVIHSSWVGESNPEDLFNERSEKLKDFARNHGAKITDISGCNTASRKTIAGSLVLTYGENKTIANIIDEIAPGVHDANPAEMSFEGLYMDLVTMAGNGTNTAGMWARPSTNYSSGSSVHYRGTNDMVDHWLARPQLYKPNIIYVDNTPTSTVVDSLISANKGEIPREVSISHQGNPKDGYYEWQNFTAVGGKDALPCTPVSIRLTVAEGSNVFDQVIYPDKVTVTFKEGQYPQGALLAIAVGSQQAQVADYVQLLTGHIHTMISDNQDLYIRGTDLGGGQGFAYIGGTYDTFADACDLMPASGFDNLVQW